MDREEKHFLNNISIPFYISTYENTNLYMLQTHSYHFQLFIVIERLHAIHFTIH